MSTLKVTNIESPSGGGVNAKITDINGGQLSNRNLIINGAMQVAQRGTSTSGSGGGYKTVDRFRYTRSGYTPTLAFTQETDAPDGFANSSKIAVSTAASVGANDYAEWRQHIEAQNLQHLSYGSATAKALTLSFYVKSNVTGTYSLALTQDDSSRRQSATYTVSSSGTWEYKTITFAGDASGTINNDNGSGLTLRYALSAGSDYTTGSTGTWSTTTADQYAGHAVDLLGTNSNYWQITGVQLEVGDVATAFEHRSFGDELARCLRYYFKPDTEGSAKQGMMGISYTANTYYIPFELPIPMRTAPTLVAEGGGDWRSRTNNVNNFDVTWTYHGTITPSNVIIQTTGGSIAAATPFWFETHDSSGCNLEFDAEL